MCAAGSDHEEIVNMLLDRYLNIDVQDHSGQTALMCAARSNHREIVKHLLERNANVNAQDISGWTALMYAVRGGYKEVVKLLLNHGAEINAGDQAGTAVHRKIENLLLKVGADMGGTAAGAPSHVGRKGVIHKATHDESASDSTAIEDTDTPTKNAQAGVTSLKLLDIVGRKPVSLRATKAKREKAPSPLTEPTATAVDCRYDAMEFIEREVLKQVVLVGEEEGELKTMFRCSWDICKYIEKELPPKHNLRQMVTVSGTADKACVMSCANYIRWLWPHAGVELLDAVEKAIRTQTEGMSCGEIIYKAGLTCTSFDYMPCEELFGSLYNTGLCKINHVGLCRGHDR
jgi:hypothetical protein